MQFSTLASTLLVIIITILLPLGNASLTRYQLLGGEARGAVCLDGSDASYYLYRNRTSRSWIIHLESSTFLCFGPGVNGCAGIAQTPYGSSKTWSCVLPDVLASRLDDVGRLVSSDASRNPDYLHVNRVFIRHCSGDLFTGTRGTEPYNGLYFGGHNIVRAVLEDLVRFHDFLSAEQVLFGGASLGSVIHAQFLRSTLPFAAIAVYSDGLGIRGFPGFDDVRSNITQFLSTSNGSSPYRPDITPEMSQQLIDIANTFDTMEAYIPESCRTYFNHSVFGGFECYDVTVGGVHAVPSTMAFFVFGSTWDTLFLVGSLGLRSYTCASETGQLTAEEQVYVREFGYSTQVSVRQLFENRGNRVISVYLSNCYGTSFLEDDLFCSMAQGFTPYGAATAFIQAALSGRSMLLADAFPDDGLSCSAYCGSPQCAWANGTRSQETSNSCTQDDGYSRTSLRVGRPCPGIPSIGSASVPASVMSRYNVVNASANNALCMDGSPASYYVQRNFSNGNWIVHIQGSSFCVDKESCAPVFALGMGSSNQWSCSLPGFDTSGSYATLSRPVKANPELNPAFHTWNRVYIRYCSGDLLLGRQRAETNPSNSGLNHLGFFILNRIFSDLFDYHELGTAERVVFGGSQAGAIGAQLNINRLYTELTAKRAEFGIPPALVMGYSDSGWHREVVGLGDFEANPALFSSPETSPSVTAIAAVFENTFNATGDETCMNAQENPDRAFISCLDASTLWPHIQVPMFMIASRWDIIDLTLAFGFQQIACAASTGRVTSTQREYLARYSDRSESKYEAFQQRDVNGVFLPTCFGAGHFDLPLEFLVTAPCDDIGGVSPYGALSRWVQGVISGEGAAPRLIGSTPPATAPILCDSNCASVACRWQNSSNNQDAVCRNFNVTGFDIGILFIGSPCPAMPVPPPPTGPCPEADQATSADDKYEAYLRCWSQSFSRYQEAFNRYTSGQCNN